MRGNASHDIRATRSVVTYEACNGADGSGRVVRIGHTKAPEGNHWTALLAQIGRAVEDGLLTDEVDPIVLQYALYQAGWWRSQACRRQNVDSDLADGLQAYALKQSHMWTSLGRKFASLWERTLHKDKESLSNWPTEFRVVSVTTTVSPDSNAVLHASDDNMVVDG